MIKANELRLGNLIQWQDDSHEVVTIVGIVHDKHDEDCAIYTSNKDLAAIWEFEPIPLTEEWLIKLGGELDENGYKFIYVNKDYNIRFYIHMDGFIQQTKDTHCVLANYPHVKYVHYLQNLFFALTGNELTLQK